MDRKAELEKRRKKVEELRRQRQELANNKNALATTSQSPASPKIGARNKDKADVSDLVDSLLGERSAAVSTPPASNHVSASVSPTPDSSSNKTKADNKPVELSVSESHSVSIPPKEKVTYQKGCQTEENIFEDLINEGVSEKLLELKQKETQAQEDQKQIQETNQANDNINKDDEEEQTNQAKKKVEVLNEEELMTTLQSESFLSFFDQSTRMVERSFHVDSKYDFATDYSGDTRDSSETTSDSMLTAVNTFFSEKWTSNRAVTDIDFSIKHPELFLASYGQQMSNRSATDPNGLCLVWNTHLPDRPEYVFHCQSPVMSARFSKFHPSLVIGGTYSGQIVLWDKRAKSGPVQRSTLSSKSHSHPVYSMEVVGSQNAHNLVSCSTDGYMCSWSIDMLSEPQETTILSERIKKGVAVTCMSFSEKDVNNFIVGTEEGDIHSGNRHGGQGSGTNSAPEGKKQGMVGHHGPVTSVHHHPIHGDIDFSDLIISSSTDWTVKLWSQESKKVIHSFEDADDYVYDARWSPVHPAVFASVDGNSKLSLWNLNNDTEFPSYECIVNEKAALNRVKWADDGKHLVTGDVDGKLHLYEAGEQIYNPRFDAWTKFRETIKELTAVNEMVSMRKPNFASNFSASDYRQPHNRLV